MKPGVFTSELWVVLAAGVNAATGALSSNEHVNLGTLAAAVAYAVCRTVLKLTAVKRAGEPTGS